MAVESLQDRIDEAGSAAAMLQAPRPFFNPFPYTPEHTNWRSEQAAWTSTAVLLDQSFHMFDFYIKGPDVAKLLSDTGVNSFAKWGKDRAKQWVGVNEDGYVVADGVVFGLTDDEVVITGNEIAANWIEYQASLGDYDVTFHRDPGSGAGPVPKRYYRYELQGPTAWAILEEAHGGPIDHIPFFRMGEFTIGELTVRALNHTMAATSGDAHTGLELFGPMEENDRFLELILAAGEKHGLVRGGAITYLSATMESGWVPVPLPAVYGDDLLAYRQSLGPWALENFIATGGSSFRPADVSEYYATPWDLGLDHVIRFDHDFIGRKALEKMAEAPRRRRVWLQWNEDDAARVAASGIVDGPDRAKPIIVPTTWSLYDEIKLGDKSVGIATMHGYTVGIGHWESIGRVDNDIQDGTEVEIVWGMADGGASDPFVPPHKQTTIRATVRTSPPRPAGNGA